MISLVAGADVGGTFTDLVIFDPATGAVKLAKVPTTLDPAKGGQAQGVLRRSRPPGWPWPISG